MMTERELRLRSLQSEGWYRITVIEGVSEVLSISGQTPFPAKGSAERKLIGEVVLRALGVEP